MRINRSCDILDKPGYKMGRMNLHGSLALVQCWRSWTVSLRRVAKMSQHSLVGALLYQCEAHRIRGQPM